MKKLTVYIVCFLFTFILLPLAVFFTVNTFGIGKKYEIISNAQTEIGQLSIGRGGIDEALKDSGIKENLQEEIKYIEKQ